MQNGIGIILLVVAGLGVALFLGYQNKTEVKMCETEVYKEAEATGAKSVELDTGASKNRVLVPCDDLKPDQN